MKAFRYFVMRLSAVLFVMLLIIALILPASADTASPTLDAADAVMLVNMNCDKTLLSKNADRLIYPASTAKMTAGILACKLLSDRYDEPVTLTSDMLSGNNGYSFGFRIGQTVTIRDLIFAVGCGSCGDAAAALAVIASGSREAFVGEMNKFAAGLGATSTVYKNVSGLDEDGAMTTVRDVAKIAAAAYDYKLFLEASYSYVYSFCFADGSSGKITNRNELHNIYGEFSNNHALGLTSGETELGGCCTVTIGKYGDALYVCAVMGTDNTNRYSLVNSLLGWASENYVYEPYMKADTVIGKLPVEMSDSASEASVILTDDVGILLRDVANSSDCRYEIRYASPILTAPVKCGDTVGWLTVWNGDEFITSVPLTVKENVESNGFLILMRSMREYFTGRTFIVTVIAAAALVTVMILILKFTSRGSRRYGGRRHGTSFRLK